MDNLEGVLIGFKQAFSDAAKDIFGDLFIQLRGNISNIKKGRLLAAFCHLIMNVI